MEIVRAVLVRLDIELRVTLAHLRCSERRVETGIEFVHDRLRRAVADKDAVPVQRLKTWKRFGNRRNVRQPGEPTSPGVGASPLSLPALISPVAVTALPKKYFTWPDIRSLSACAPPRYGTWCTVIPALCLKISRHRCDKEPKPAEAISMPCGDDLARLISSATVLTGADGVTTRMAGACDTKKTGTKSRA